MTNELVPQPPQPPKPEQAGKPDPHRRFALCIDGDKLYLSAKERLICETWVRTNGNIAECARAANKAFNRKHSAETIKRWVNEKQLITRYIEELADKKEELEGFDENEWKLMGIQALKGKRNMTPLQRQLWADWGRLEVYKGEASGGGGGGRNVNLQINFGDKSDQD